MTAVDTVTKKKKSEKTHAAVQFEGEFYDYDYYKEYADLDDEDLDIESSSGHDIDGHLEINEFATTEFDDTWDRDEAWDEIATMTATDGREIRRKCLHIWNGRLCLCQFLGWIDDGKKYHCTYHQVGDAMDSTDRQYPDVPAPQIAKLAEPPKPVHTESRPKELDSFRDHDKVAISHTKIEGPNTHKLSAFEHFTPYDGHFVRD